MIKLLLSLINISLLRLSCLWFVTVAVNFPASVHADELSDALKENKASETEDPVSLVRECFESYRRAIMTPDPDQAYALINENTKQYYSQMLDKSRYATSDEIQALTFLEKVFIVLIRQRVSTEKLTSFDTEGFFKHAVREGWVGRDNVEKVQLVNITTNGDTASSQIKTEKSALPFGFSFTREVDGWKIDLVSIIPLSNLAITHAINNAEQSESEILSELVEKLTGRPADPSVWDPPLTR